MGRVYLARDHQLDRDVAVKVLSPNILHEERAKVRFVTEARAAAALDHPHIATIFEIGQADGERLFIAMQYYEGETLEQRIERGPLPAEKAVGYAKQILLGLQAAHQKKIVHRDIKPANLIITQPGRIKIVDFGIARMADHDHVSIGQIAGTMAYMSPEQAQGLEIDHRTDLWSLGVILYEMLTRVRPFQGEYLDSIRYAILNDIPDPLTNHLDQVDPAIQLVVDRLLSKSCDDRYQDAAEVIADLERVIEGVNRQSGSGDSRRDNERLPENLPSYLSSFVGRERELKQVLGILANTRLLTITGTGGAGKTRFSLLVASAIQLQFEHGVAFVPLATVRDSDLVLSTIAQSLRVREMEGASIRDRLIDYLRDKNGLLILDNFEQVLAAGEVIADILSECASLSILVTSRFSLRIQGEHEFPLPALSLATLAPGQSIEQIKQCESVALFEQRARAIKPSFSLDAANIENVVHICNRLDGLPLAIELAAARIKVLPPRAILERLDQRLYLLTGGSRDLPERHRALRETIAWSYDLLSKEEKRLFRWSSFFSGDYTFEAAEYVGNILSKNSMNVLDRLGALVDKNLIVQDETPGGEGYFYALETIKEFGLECLVASGEESLVRAVHKDYYLSLVERVAPLLTGPSQGYWLNRLEREHNNIRSVLDAAITTDVSVAVRLGVGLWRFWLIRGYFNEGLSYIEHVLGYLEEGDDPLLRSRLLAAGGTLAHNCGQFRKSLLLYEKNLSVCRTLNDKSGLAQAQNHLGWVSWRLSEYAAAKEYSGEGLRLFEELQDQPGIARSHSNLGWVAQYEGDFDKARAHFEQAFDIYHALNDKRNAAFMKNCLGWAWATSGDMDRGCRMLEDALLDFRSIKDKQLTAFTEGRLGVLAHAQGDFERSRDHLEKRCLLIFRQIGDAWGAGFASAGLGRVLQDCGAYAEAEELYFESLSIRKGIEDTFGIAESFCRIAELKRLTNDLKEAADYYKKSLDLRRQIGDKHGQAECLKGLKMLQSE